MIVHVFPSVDNLTSHYHSGGGLVVVAETLADVQRLLADYPEIQLTEEECSRHVKYSVDRSQAASPAVYIFPDAGCC